MRTTVQQHLARAASTLTKEAGDISSVFPSLSGKKPDPLPKKFSDLKRQIVAGREDVIQGAWNRLLASLSTEIKEVQRKGNQVSHYQ